MKIGSVTPRLGAWCRAIAVLPFALSLSACEPSRSFEKSVDGTITYIDELSEEDKTQARQTIVTGLQRGLDTYRLNVGDSLQALFRIRREPTADEYTLSVGDEIHIEFLHDSDFNRTVKVRPDGRISSPLKGTITAAGLTSSQLADIIEQEYRQILAAPVVTVNVSEFTEPLDEFLRVIENTQSARSLEISIAPDGTVILPLLPPIQAQGMTLQELEALIDETYAAIGLKVAVSLLPASIGTDRIFIFGEVAKAGPVVSQRPQTVLMAIASAGGITESGSMQAVKLFYVDDESKPRVRSVNLQNILQELRLEEDMLVPDNSVIYVPPTKLATAGRYVDQILRDILMFNGFNAGISASYIINQVEEGGGTSVITTP